MHLEVIPGRDCGTCNVCCVALTVDEPALQKVQGYRCKNLSADKRCIIYADRPRTCRDFNCGWRLLKWVKSTLRPNQSDVLIGLQHAGDEGLGITVTLLSQAALKAEGLAETVAAAIAAGVPVFLHVPGPPGYTSAKARIDGLLTHAVATRDKAAVLDILRQARKQGRAGETVPIRLAPPSATTQGG